MSSAYFPEGTNIDWLDLPDGMRLRTAAIMPACEVRGQVVVINGHREYMEKYREFFQEFLDRGFQVFSMDLRGQGLSGRLLEDRHRSYIDSFDLYLSDLAQMMSHYGLLDRQDRHLPLFLMGHSMGGHIAFRFLHDHPDVFDRAVLLSPMMGINLGPPVKAMMSRWWIEFSCLFGFDKEYAPGQGPGLGEGFEPLVRELLTHDLSRYETENRVIAANPDLYSGGATFRWLKAALDSIFVIKQRGYAEAIPLPVLALLAEKEKLVVNKEAQDILGRLPEGRIEIIKGAFHEIYRETDEVRREMWRIMDEFLAV
ncbi:alpha/beta fold hydrolase [Emcibacter sp.]|uniref:alpha/beta fold hydrolase n=1 Tax=Emcibacter sp. TaxID=1979954 RepID=UPI003A941267